MALQRHVITSVLKPTFVPPVNIRDALRDYADARFSVTLLASGEPVAGEVHRVGTAQNAQRLQESLPDAGTPQQSDLRHKTSSEIARVLECERRVFEAPLWFSFSDGVFEFSRSIDCDDADLDIARELVTNHYAIAFLQTLGNLVSVE